MFQLMFGLGQPTPGDVKFRSASNTVKRARTERNGDEVHIFDNHGKLVGMAKTQGGHTLFYKHGELLGKAAGDWLESVSDPIIDRVRNGEDIDEVIDSVSTIEIRRSMVA